MAAECRLRAKGARRGWQSLRARKSVSLDELDWKERGRDAPENDVFLSQLNPFWQIAMRSKALPLHTQSMPSLSVGE